MLISSIFLPIAGVLGALAVGLGAFGAHALKARLTEANLTTFETGVRYHFYHTLALLGIGLADAMGAGDSFLSAAGWLMLLGILLFSGSLYWLALDGPRWLGPVTPLGGLAFILGWVALAIAL